MIPLPAVLAAANCSRNKLTKWRADGHLTHDIPRGSPGVPTFVSRSAALEIVFMAYLTAYGYEPASARRAAETWWKRIVRGERLAPFWRLNSAGGTIAPAGTLKNVSGAFHAQADHVGMPGGQMRRNAGALLIVNLRELVSRVDALEAFPWGR